MRIYIFLFCIIGFLILIPTISIAVASFIITSQDYICDSSLIDLNIWLIINSSISLGLAGIYILLIIIFLVSEKYKYLIIFMVIYILNLVFIIIWNIIGAIQLFKYSWTCELSNIVLISLIFQWLSIIQAIFINRFNNFIFIEKNNNNNFV